LLQTDKIMKKPKESEDKTVTRGSGTNNVATNVKWANGTKEGNKETKVSK